MLIPRSSLIDLKHRSIKIDTISDTASERAERIEKKNVSEPQFQVAIRLSQSFYRIECLCGVLCAIDIEWVMKWFFFVVDATGSITVTDSRANVYAPLLFFISTLATTATAI